MQQFFIAQRFFYCLLIICRTVPELWFIECNQPNNTTMTINKKGNIHFEYYPYNLRRSDL